MLVVGSALMAVMAVAVVALLAAAVEAEAVAVASFFLAVQTAGDGVPAAGRGGVLSAVASAAAAASVAAVVAESGVAVGVVVLVRVGGERVVGVASLGSSRALVLVGSSRYIHFQHCPLFSFCEHTTRMPTTRMPTTRRPKTRSMKAIAPSATRPAPSPSPTECDEPKTKMQRIDVHVPTNPLTQVPPTLQCAICCTEFFRPNDGIFCQVRVTNREDKEPHLSSIAHCDPQTRVINNRPILRVLFLKAQ